MSSNSNQVDKLFRYLYFPLNEGAVQRYAYFSNNRSIVHAVLSRVVVAPIVRRLPSVFTPKTLTLFGFIFAGIAFFCALAYRGRYPNITLPLIALCTTLHILSDVLVEPLAKIRKDTSLLTHFLQHYAQGFALGFFSLSAIALFSSDEFIYGPILLISVHIAMFTGLQEISIRKTTFRIEKIGPLEALSVLALLCLVCLNRELFWKLLDSEQYGIAMFDITLLAVSFGAAATAIETIRRSKLYLTPATLLYLAGCIFFVLLMFEMKNTMFAMVLFIFFSSEFFGRMILARIIHTEPVSPSVMPLIIALVAIQAEHYFWDLQLSGYILAIVLILQHVSLAYYAFTKLADRYMDLPFRRV
ncbi:MAG: hypothetical protein KDD70_05980 [Bdellovibrionales bacterium]|nr:hypothetical protein [Bdellovibrionales bacterium]